jgi:hypothetical protein
MSTEAAVAADPVASWNYDQVIDWTSSVVVSQKCYSREIRANSLGGKSLLRLSKYVEEGNEDWARQILKEAGILALGDQLAILEALTDLQDFSRASRADSQESKRLNDFEERDRLIENPLVSQVASSRASRADGFQRSRVETQEQKTGFNYSNPAFSHEDEHTEERGTTTGVKRLSAPRWSINPEELASKTNSPEELLPGICGVIFSTLLNWSEHLKLVAIVLIFVTWYELNMWVGFFLSPQSFRGKYVLIWLAYFPYRSLSYFIFMVRTFGISQQVSTKLMLRTFYTISVFVSIENLDARLSWARLRSSGMENHIHNDVRAVCSWIIAPADTLVPN